jgi:hypothetical protein
MKSTITKSVVAATAVATALTFGTAVAGAAPNAPAQPTKPSHPPISVQVAPGVQYTGDAKTGTTELVTPFGVVRTAPGQVAVVDNSGKTVFGNPALTGPKPSASGTAPNAPISNGAKHHAADVTKNDTMSQKDKNDAIQDGINNVATNFGLATGVGAMVGGVGGTIVGCLAGGALGIAEGPLSIGTCIIGGGTLGGLGAIIGGAAVGVPVGIASGVYEYQQLQAQGVL